jgi:exopolysaccharide biosynthesis protein
MSNGAISSTTPFDSGWQPIHTGIEWRQLEVAHTNTDWLSPISVVRINQQHATFRVGYAPTEPRLLRNWCAEPGVLAAINGSFFDENYQSTALVISDHTVNGTSYQGQGGMFAVDSWGNVSLRYLGATPYNPNESLAQALQGWPMLIQPGGGPLYPDTSTANPARRSVLAMDRSGNVLLIAFSGRDFTLPALTDWLATSDLQIDSALNLDGGASTGLCVQTDTFQERIEAYSLLPIVLLVYAS